MGLDDDNAYNCIRLDIGYDGTAFDRQAAALEKLAYDAAEQRRSNDQTSRGPHLPSRGIEISGTELRHFILDTEANDSRDSQIGDISSPVFSQDQFIVSWAKRYSRHVPLYVEWWNTLLEIRRVMLTLQQTGGLKVIQILG